MNILLTLQKKLKKNTMSTFCENTSFVDRKKQSEEILKRYPNRVPIIVELSKHDHSLKPIDRTKYLVPIDLKLSNFLLLIRKRIELDNTKALYLFFNDKLVAGTSHTMGSLYTTHSNEDGFLYCIYAGESTFG